MDSPFPRIFKQILGRTSEQMCQVLLNYIEPKGWRNDLKVTSFFSNRRFLKFSGHFLQGIMGKILILPLNDNC